MTLAYVSLGSNLGEREVTIRRAAELIGATRLSSLRETEPWGFENQPRFVNAAATVETELSARELLDVLLAVERDLGRDRGSGPRYGPRTIDLDLLLYGSEKSDLPALQLPHPRLHERLFVLLPLAELAPDLVVPGKETVADLLTKLQSAP